MVGISARALCTAASALPVFPVPLGFCQQLWVYSHFGDKLWSEGDPPYPLVLPQKQVEAEWGGEQEVLRTPVQVGSPIAACP